MQNQTQNLGSALGRVSIYTIQQRSSRWIVGTGFTLIELMVVIAIILMLAGIIAASLSTAWMRSRDARRVSDIKSIEVALSLYYNDNSCYPNTIYTAASNVCPGATSAVSFVPTYMPAVPVDPNGGGNYSYSALNTGCTGYHLGATLEQSSNSALNSDADASTGTACTGSAADFSGTDPVYDAHS